MKIRRKKSLFTRASSVCFCLFVFCTTVTGSESNGEAESVDATATGTPRDSEKTDVKREDILDRAFSPLDRAVSDINRDLNKGDASADPESTE